MEKNRKVLVISGGSSGIGLAIAEKFAAAGWCVYNLSRTQVYPSPDGTVVLNPKINFIKTDVGIEDSIEQALAEIRTREGHIDLLVANAGYGIAGAIEDTCEEAYVRQFNINFFGTVRLVRASLPLLRLSKRGRVIIMSSLAAVLPIPFQAFYAASKAALVNFSRALNLEVQRDNIKVTALLPGDIASGFTANRQKSLIEESPYFAIYSKSLSRMEHDELKGKPTTFIAKYVWHIYHKSRPKSMYVAGTKYRIFYALACHLPVRVADFILAYLYAR